MPGPSTCPHTINHRMSKKLLSGHTFLGPLKRTGHRQLGFDKISEVLGFPTYPAHLSWPRPWKLSRMLFPHHTTLVLVSFSLSISLRLSHECPGPPVLTPNTPRAPVKTVPAALKAAAVAGKLRRRGLAGDAVCTYICISWHQVSHYCRCKGL